MQDWCGAATNNPTTGKGCIGAVNWRSNGRTAQPRPSAVEQAATIGSNVTCPAILDLACSFGRPRSYRHDTHGVRRRSVHNFRTDRQIHQDVALLVGHSVNASRFEKNGRLFTEGLLVLGQLREVHSDWPKLTAGNGKLRGVFIEAKWLSPSALSSLRDKASDTGDLGVIEITDAHLVIRRKQIESGTNAFHIIGPRATRSYE